MEKGVGGGGGGRKETEVASTVLPHLQRLD